MATQKEILEVGADANRAGNEVRSALDLVQYQRPATGAFAAGATVDVTIEHTGFDPVTVLTGVSLDADFVLRPRAPVHDSAGAAIAGSSTRHQLAGGRVRVAVTGGGEGNTGSFLILFDR